MKRLHLCFLLAVFSLFVLGCSEDSASVVQNENGSDLPQQQGSEIPSDSSSEILGNKPFEEAFIIAPNTDSLNVTDSERSFLDSL